MVCTKCQALCVVCPGCKMVAQVPPGEGGIETHCQCGHSLTIEDIAPSTGLGTAVGWAFKGIALPAKLVPVVGEFIQIGIDDGLGGYLEEKTNEAIHKRRKKSDADR